MASIVSGSPEEIWVPVSTASAQVILVGSVVTDGTDGVLPLGAASGAMDTSGKGDCSAGVTANWRAPLGVVTALSKKESTFSSTYKVNTGTAVITSNANYTSDPTAGLGRWSKNDKRLYAKIAVINPTTKIRFPVYNGALGTALTVGTISTGSATGVGCTTSAIQVSATVVNTSTVYFRTGNNAGLYRTPATSSATVLTWTSPTPYATAVGDTVVGCCLKSYGFTNFQLDATSSWVDGSFDDMASSVSYYSGIVHRLDLSEAGKEYVELCFGAYAFIPELA